MYILIKTKLAVYEITQTLFKPALEITSFTKTRLVERKI